MILLTGGGGYIGSVLAQRLAHAKTPLRIFDKFYFGNDPLKQLKGKTEIVSGDVRSFPENVLDGVDVVIHLAALSNDPTADFSPTTNKEINTTATLNLVILAKKKGVKKFILASSCSIYDLPDEKNVRLKNESSYVSPTAFYSVSKREAEKGLLKMADNHFCVSILRKGTVFGYSPRMRFDLVVNTMVKDALSRRIIKIVGEGNHWRPLVDVEDAAEAYWTILNAAAAKVNGQIFNISLGNFLVKDLAQEVKRVLFKNFAINTQIVYEPPREKIRSYKVSNLKAKRNLNFVPKMTIEESIVKMVNKIRENEIKMDDPIYYNIEWMKPILEEEK